ncbi:VOC family protein [Kamptonema sp. UHCC 0994]|uniref:VOC family protein n=1 Tax=Kamptonema sp. UHCC 0994 TaxID=3031329 RepID=UPI0023B94157|nr:VOC family protein [Kamptonema sp. UHCC 0994]MDF0551931.1 VOC family protein [Kamptonema sp. UHCC 0994]
MNQVIFHLAFPVADIAQTKAFYGDGLGCEIGRESPNSLILGLCGHQIVAHVSHEPLTPQRGIYPRHFGLVFTSEADWEALLERSQQKGLQFYQQPKLRFVGLPTEHRTFFLIDPFDNILEFKYYRETEAIFGYSEYDQVGDAV